MTGPVVGIVGYHHLVPRPWGALQVSGAPTSYVDSVRAAGGRPILFPQDDGIALLDVVDALVLTGGGDVDPRLYGGDVGSALDVDPARDAAEVALVRSAVDAGLPLLAICRGLQVLVVADGGTLRAGVEHIRPESGHDVRTAPGSLAQRLLGTSCRTSALHRQAVADPGPRWRATAWAEDGSIEAVEPADDLPVLGVQWHPEMSSAPVADTTGSAMFGWLVSEARDRQGRSTREVRDGRPLLARRG